MSEPENVGQSWEEKPDFVLMGTPKKITYRAIDIRWEKPRNIAHLLSLIWGSDIWVQGVPLLKTTIALTIALTLLFWWLLG